LAVRLSARWIVPRIDEAGFAERRGDAYIWIARQAPLEEAMPTTPLMRLFVGGLAGALASFFPRLAAILAGNPTENIEIFSVTYLVVGVIVALIVGLVVMIIDGDANRQLRDVFMTALGVPTLLMGALTTTATTQNVAQNDQKLRSIVERVAKSSGIEVRSDVEIVAPTSRNENWTPLDLFMSPAHAQSASAPMAGNKFGIVARERQYTLVLQRAAQEKELHDLQKTLTSQGLPTRTLQQSDGKYLLVPAGAPKPYSDAVLEGVRAKELGAKPFLVEAAVR